jgi:phosphoglycerate dehydrogenase-like enzyme
MTSTGKRILITTILCAPGDETHHLLEEAGYVTTHNRWHGGRIEEEMISLLQDVDGLIVGSDPVTARVLRASPRLRVVCRPAVGYDNIDVSAATALGIAVCTTPGLNRTAVAEYTIGLLLQCSRRVLENLEEGHRGGWQEQRGRDLAGRTLGIGKEVAKRARAFDMTVLAYDQKPDPVFARDHGVAYAPLERLLRESDHVTLHVNLDGSTRHLLNAERLALMKPTAYLINTSRGAVVDTAALCRVLTERKLAGAALDVFECEPLEADSPLRRLENLYISPHAAGASEDYLRSAPLVSAESAMAVLEGRRPPFLVNPHVLAPRG